MSGIGVSVLWKRWGGITEPQNQLLWEPCSAGAEGRCGECLWGPQVLCSTAQRAPLSWSGAGMANPLVERQEPGNTQVPGRLPPGLTASASPGETFSLEFCQFPSAGTTPPVQ